MREIEQCHFGVYFSSFVGLRRAETAIAQAYFYFSHELSAATAAPFILIVVARRQSRKAVYYLRALLHIFRALHIDAHSRANKCTFVKKNCSVPRNSYCKLRACRGTWRAVTRSSIFYPDR